MLSFLKVALSNNPTYNPTYILIGSHGPAPRSAPHGSKEGSAVDGASVTLRKNDILLRHHNKNWQDVIEGLITILQIAHTNKI